MNMIPVNSSAISSIGYDPISKGMKVMFKQGKTYDFCNVPQHIFDSFISSTSKGIYYNSYIRDRYQCY